MDSLKGFFSKHDAARAQWGRVNEPATNGQGLRLASERATAALYARLPFRWQPGVVVSRYQGPPVWEKGPAAIHIMLLEETYVTEGKDARRVGDWLCKASLDTDTGELRYESQLAPWHADGTGGPNASYLPTPTCKNCLKKAQAFPSRS
jgi:hypothetical protein